MKRRETHISIQFRQPPLMLFRDTPVEQLQPNRLVIHIQPDEAITLSFGAKIPGPQLRLGTVDMRFAYKDYFGERPSTGYERLLYDCMTGDATLFQRSDMVEAGMGRRRADPRRVEGAAAERLSRTTPPARGDRRKPTS